jgi:hypothetical protein
MPNASAQPECRLAAWFTTMNTSLFTWPEVQLRCMMNDSDQTARQLIKQDANSIRGVDDTQELRDVQFV